MSICRDSGNGLESQFCQTVVRTPFDVLKAYCSPAAGTPAFVSVSIRYSERLNSQTQKVSSHSHLRACFQFPKLFNVTEVNVRLVNIAPVEIGRHASWRKGMLVDIRAFPQDIRRQQQQPSETDDDESGSKMLSLVR